MTPFERRRKEKPLKPQPLGVESSIVPSPVSHSPSLLFYQTIPPYLSVSYFLWCFAPLVVLGSVCFLLFLCVPSTLRAWERRTKTVVLQQKTVWGKTKTFTMTSKRKGTNDWDFLSFFFFGCHLRPPKFPSTPVVPRVPFEPVKP